MADKKPRPYWHVDAKWIFGIIFFISAFVSLVLFTTSTLLSPQVAVPVATYVVASQFSRNGLDEKIDLTTLKSQLESSGGENSFNLGGFKISVTNKDLNTLSPRELRLKVFGQVVETIYYQKTEVPDAAKQYGVLAYFNKANADKFANFFKLSLVPVFLSAAGLVFFSYKYGRLISPAIPLILLGTLPSFLLFLVQNAKPRSGETGPFSFLPHEMVVDIAQRLSRVYYAIVGVGILLIVAAIVAKVFSRFKAKV